ncbi:hypothetical protein [Brevundimonas sp.]|uniref:hypothetical protein n=1 Tax=Brevundimonas sp. TaxID=1871086 RepID=UPI002601E8CE|nr:hypothetical protein [Brevundimonas sp.]
MNLFKKQSVPTPSPVKPTHVVIVELWKIKVHAEGWGIPAAVVIISLMIFLFALGSAAGSRMFTNATNNVLGIEQTAPAVPDRPPS